MKLSEKDKERIMIALWRYREFYGERSRHARLDHGNLEESRVCDQECGAISALMERVRGG